MKHQAPLPSRNGRSPAVQSFFTLVSSPIPASAAAIRNWLAVTSRAVHSLGIQPWLFTTITAKKPNRNHGTATLARFPSAQRRRVARNPSVNTTGASSITRESLLIAPYCALRLPPWNAAAITCAISGIDAPVHSPYAEDGIPIATAASG